MIRKSFILPLLLFLFIPTFVFAEGIVFPLPKGPVYITVGYGDYVTHQGIRSKYALDMQSFDGSKSRVESGGGACNTIGAPILASQSGEVIEAVNPDEKTIDRGYGVKVTIKNTDNSTTTYGHMIDGSLAVKVGDTVEQGQILGLLGGTGRVGGNSCEWKDFKGGSTTYNGPHLHMERYKTEGSIAMKPEPLVGKENYKDIKSSTSSPFYSATQMTAGSFDFWNRFKNKVPYRLMYNPTEIHRIEPLYAKRDERQTFTVYGEGLPDDLSVDLNHCANPQWIERGNEKQVFSCEVNPPAGIPMLRGGRLSSGTATYDFSFNIEVIDSDELPEPQITDLEIEGGYRAGQNATFRVKGLHLPADLKFNQDFCNAPIFKKQTPTEQAFSCILPVTILDDAGRRINDQHTLDLNLLSESRNLSHPFSFDLGLEFRLDGIEPFYVQYGKKNQFTFTGRNIDFAKAFFIGKCADITILESSPEKAVVECHALEKDGFSLINAFLPGLKGYEFFDLKIKDEPGGNLLFDYAIPAIEAPTTQINFFIPQNPTLNKVNVFTVRGSNLPLDPLVWIEGCSDMEPNWKLYQEMESSGVFKHQARTVLIKIPGERTMSGNAKTIYEAVIHPISEYADQIFTAYGGQEEVEEISSSGFDEDILEYVLEADGNYSDEFLESVGWRKFSENDIGDYENTLRYSNNFSVTNEYPYYERIYFAYDRSTLCNTEIDINNNNFGNLKWTTREWVTIPINQRWLNLFGPCSHDWLINYSNPRLEIFALKEFGVEMEKIWKIREQMSLNPMLKGIDREPKSDKWHTVDNSYLWFKAEDKSKPLLTEPIDCLIGDDERGLLEKYKSIDKRGASEMIWQLNQSDDVKFFTQNALDFGIFQANKISDGLNAGGYSCSGFWEQYLGLFTADQILKSILGDSF